MTRFGVMKHLRILEEAELVVTKRRGREKLHFLNAVPIRISTIDGSTNTPHPMTAMLTAPQERNRGRTHGEGLRDLHQDDTRTALAGDHRSRAPIEVPGRGCIPTGSPGAPYYARTTDLTVSPGVEIANGENVEVDPPRRLVQSFRAQWSDEVKREGESRVTWEIDRVGDRAG